MALELVVITKILYLQFIPYRFLLEHRINYMISNVYACMCIFYGYIREIEVGNYNWRDKRSKRLYMERARQR